MTTCPECREDFPKKRSNQVYCCAVCRWNAWNKRHPRISFNKVNELDEYDKLTHDDLRDPFLGNKL